MQNSEDLCLTKNKYQQFFISWLYIVQVHIKTQKSILLRRTLDFRQTSTPEESASHHVKDQSREIDFKKNPLFLKKYKFDITKQKKVLKNKK